MKLSPLALNWKPFAIYLKEVCGRTERSANKIAREAYQRQWGMTPEDHRRFIEDLWETYPKKTDKAIWQ